MNHNHPFHLVNESPWPLTGALGGMNLTLGMIMWFHQYKLLLMMISIIIMLLTMYQWWRDIIRESSFQGMHSMLVNKGLRMGMILFIVSEILFFFSFFWSFFHSSLSPSIEIGMIWPPLNLQPFNPFQIPLLNTTILLSSGITITWTHHSILNANHYESLQSLFITIILGIYFSFLQGFEYMEASFTFSDSIYGSTFFLATGFHGIHVLIGTMFLMICLIRMNNYQFNTSHHFGFEAAAWYWHFVDIVWLFLYISIYWWGS
uniref:Cytochrome c oxidase subunit 3 n=1 Tax=Xenopsylla cheopis TaxID=163159 RepID=A0A8F6AGG3_XENCH|nr:cytochrome c oxidase subunit 3 [Xenopsylla cheopis]